MQKFCIKFCIKICIKFCIQGENHEKARVLWSRALQVWPRAQADGVLSCRHAGGVVAPRWMQSDAASPCPGGRTDDHGPGCAGPAAPRGRCSRTEPGSPASAPAGSAGGKQRWDVEIPLTLFPKRDRGFTRVECIIEFRGDAGEIPGFRVVELFPGERSMVYAQGVIGGELELNTRVGMKLPVVLPGGVSVLDAQAKVYGQGAAKFEYKAERQCVVAEIVRGTGARWRLDDLQDPKKVGVESHQLKVVLETGPNTPPVHAAGYLNAYSEEQWMTQPISDLMGKLTHNLLKFFQKGAPAEAYAEWQNILAV